MEIIFEHVFLKIVKYNVQMLSINIPIWYRFFQLEINMIHSIASLEICRFQTSSMHMRCSPTHWCFSIQPALLVLLSAQWITDALSVCALVLCHCTAVCNTCLEFKQFRRQQGDPLIQTSASKLQHFIIISPAVNFMIQSRSDNISMVDFLSKALHIERG